MNTGTDEDGIRLEAITMRRIVASASRMRLPSCLKRGITKTGYTKVVY